jgi:hypothetical protein
MNSSETDWQNIIEVASVICTVGIVPGIGWAFSVTRKIQDLSTKISMISTQLDGKRDDESRIIEEIRSLRSSVDNLKSDLLQRIAKVETKLEKQ